MVSKILPLVAIAAVLAPVQVHAQSPVYGQCGGIGWTGATTCVSGTYCSKGNDYYSQCLPGTSSAAATPKPTTLITSTKTGTSTNASPTPAPEPQNPFAGVQLYANPYYSSEIHTSAIPTLGANAAKASAVAKVGTFTWLDTAAKVPTVGTYLSNIAAKNAAGASPKIAGAFVVYNLPDRDCAAESSAGEYSIANDGVANYKAYIDAIRTQILKYPTTKVILVVEPDSLANLVTNLNVQKCANAQTAYKACVTYAIQQLNLPNVSIYLDAGHAGWLGWFANIGPAATLFGDLYKSAGSPAAVRGLATNVANYNAFSIATCPAYTQGNTNCDEKRYINALAPLLTAAGFPAHFIMDTSRNGAQPTAQQAWGNWCNLRGAGFGIRPTTATGDPLEDAFVWVKPGGESDGSSNPSAPRYDTHCGLAEALKPAPQAGTWFDAYFEQLLVNAVPSF